MKQVLWQSLLISTSSAFLSHQALAFNYHELEVYSWQTEGKGVTEIENFLLLSNGQDRENNSSILRNTLEVNHGLTDWLELAIYNDFYRIENESWKQAATRLRAHLSWNEKGEWPIDIGAYFELAKPKEGNVNWEAEGKLILEKDLGRWTLTLNPILEIENEDELEIKADGSTETETENEIEKAYASSISYRLSESFMPKLSFFDELKDGKKKVTIIYPSADFKLTPHFKAGLALGFGLTAASEKRLLNTKVEWEF